MSEYSVTFVKGSWWERPERLMLPSGVKVETTVAATAVQAIANVEAENPDAFDVVNVQKSNILNEMA